MLSDMKRKPIDDLIEPIHYQEAVRNALTSVEAHLKRPYELATKKYKDEYEEVLWAVAETPKASMGPISA